ncbi:MAG: hypothetical protein WB698_07900 [Solirubrobacteraceae bacterium]
MQGRPSSELWRCTHCADLIGAYEPTVAVEDGRARRTSRTAEQRAGRLTSEHYHHACYVLAYGEPLAE